MPFPLGALADPLAQGFDLGRGEFLAALGRGHDFIGVMAGDALEQFLQDGPSGFFLVQAELRFSCLSIGTMTLIAIGSENRAYIPVIGNRFRTCTRCRQGDCEQQWPSAKKHLQKMGQQSRSVTFLLKKGVFCEYVTGFRCYFPEKYLAPCRHLFNIVTDRKGIASG